MSLKRIQAGLAKISPYNPNPVMRGKTPLEYNSHDKISSGMAGRQTAEAEAPPVENTVVTAAVEELLRSETDETRKESLVGWFKQYHPDKIPELGGE